MRAEYLLVSSLSSERIRLLVHILCELKESRGITAEKLKDAGQDVRRQIQPESRLQVLDEIYYVRYMEELYMEGKISTHSLPYLRGLKATPQHQATNTFYRRGHNDLRFSCPSG